MSTFTSSPTPEEIRAELRKIGVAGTERLTPQDCEPHAPAGKWEDCSDDPCKDVDCLPPKECVEGNCVCPEGMVAHGDLCIPDDPCLGVLCQPNATCDEDSGGCLCDEGFIENDKGECVRDPSDPSAECFEEEEDCCSNNPTIQIKAGRGLGGGGSFRLNQSCDKSIQLWVDSGAETAADEECAEDGRSKACSCSYEISQLMDMIADLQSELELIKDNAEQCLTKNDC